MTEPDKQPSPDILNALIEAFAKLHPILSYGGLFGVILIIILTITGVLPDALLWLPLVALVVFLVYAYMEKRFELDRWRAEQEFTLRQQAQEQRHTETMAQVSQPKPPVPSETLDQKPAEPPAADHPADDREWERRYLTHLVHLCGYPSSMALIDIKEAGLGSHKLALDRIFTSLDVPSQAVLARGGADGQQLDLDQLHQLSQKQRQPALTALSQAENKRLVLLGAPGSGKSTLVNYLTLCLAGDHLQDSRINQDQLHENGWALGAQRLWPVRLILREYAARGLSQQLDIWDYIEADLSRASVKLSGYVPLLKKRLQQEGGILLLDGLDEVDKADEVRQWLKTNIELFARDFPLVRIVVTSRPYAYGNGWELRGFQVTRLLPFSQEQIEAFIKQWYTVMGQEDGTLGPEKAESYAKGLVHQVERQANLRDMARHPLLLTMMVYIHRGREGGALPQRREELYRLCVILLLDLWRRSKQIAGHKTETLSDLLGVGTEQLLKALAEVAYMAHQQQPQASQTADIPGSLLAQILYKHKGRESRVDIDDIIEYVRDRAGLLEAHGRSSDDQEDIYRFPHRTFQEYLAGLHLLKHNFPHELARLGRDDPGRWRETVLLAAAGQRDVPFTVWALVGGLCPQAPPSLTPSPLPQGTAAPQQAQGWRTQVDPAAVWGAFLAGQALLETDLFPPEQAQNEDEQARRERVRQWQSQIVTAGLLPPRDRALAGEALVQLGETRPGVLACDEMPFCTIPGGRFWLANWEKGGAGDWYEALNKPYWLAQHPVTVAQFRQFVADSGHQPYWSESLRGPDNWPVAEISWYDALAFCNWLNERWQKWLPAGYQVTLPTEAEWEKGARGGEQIPVTPHIVTAATLRQTVDQLPAMQPNPQPRRDYPWGDGPEQEEITADDTLHRSNNKTAGIGDCCAVGSFPLGTAPYGCLDMSGQVWEWTRSLHGKPYPPQAAQEYETVDSGNKEDIVLRGGAYYKIENVCSVRDGVNPRYDFLDYGVRVCVSPFLTSGR